MPLDGQIFADAQQAGGFVVPQLYRTHEVVLFVKYPSFDYSSFVPINREGDMWDIGTLVYSGDIAGAASYLSGKGYDVPNATINFGVGQTNFYLAGIGYELSLQEVNRFARLTVSQSDGTLATAKARAAKLASEKFIYDRVVRGSTEKNTTGLVNNATVPAANAPNGSWGTATPAQMLADVNAALSDVITNSGETAMPDTLLLPTTAFITAGSTQLTNASESVLSFLQNNNAYTLETGNKLTIRASRELQTAGAGSTRRMVAYQNDPQNLEFYLPGMFEFRDPFQTSSMTWRVDGIMNVGQLEIYRPKALSYRDNI